MTSWKLFLSSRKSAKGPVYEEVINSRIFSAIAFLLSAIFGFYLFFPTTALQNRLVYEIERQIPVKVSLAEFSLLPILTFKGQAIDAEFTSIPNYSLRLDSLSVDPWWSSLIRGAPGVEGSLEGLGGELEFSVNNQGKFAAAAENLHLELPLATGSSLQLVGDVTSAFFEGFLPLQSAAESRVEITLSQLQIRGLNFLTQGSGDISLGQVRLSAVGEQGAFRIVQLEASGGNIEATGKGDLLLARNLPNSRINLNLIIKPGALASPELTDLLSLSGPPQADGSYRLRLSGTLARPSFN